MHLTAQPRDNWPAIVKALSFNDPDVISRFADEAGPTIQWLKQTGLRFDFLAYAISYEIAAALAAGWRWARAD